MKASDLSEKNCAHIFRADELLAQVASKKQAENRLVFDWLIFQNEFGGRFSPPELSTTGRGFPDSNNLKDPKFNRSLQYISI
jgi:hypothetical protein